MPQRDIHRAATSLQCATSVLSLKHQRMTIYVPSWTRTHDKAFMVSITTNTQFKDIV